MTTTRTDTIADRIERCFRAVDFDSLRDLYHPDAILDATVPQWRFQFQGSQRIAAWYRDAYSQVQEPRCTWLRITSAEGLVLVEWELRDGEGEQQVLVREVDIFRIEGDRIVEQTHYCPGVWDAETIARHRAEAPMVRSEP